MAAPRVRVATTAAIRMVVFFFIVRYLRFLFGNFPVLFCLNHVPCQYAYSYKFNMLRRRAVITKVSKDIILQRVGEYSPTQDRLGGNNGVSKRENEKNHCEKQNCQPLSGLVNTVTLSHSAVKTAKEQSPIRKGVFS